MLQITLAGKKAESDSKRDSNSAATDRVATTFQGMASRLISQDFRTGANPLRLVRVNFVLDLLPEEGAPLQKAHSYDARGISRVGS
jgi:hypothetical protein